MVALDVIVRPEFTNQATKMPLAERQDPIQAFLLNRSHEAFCVSIAVRRAGRRPDDANAGRPEYFLHRVGPVRISIADQDAPVTQNIIGVTDETADGLLDEGAVWMRC
jgi:hypothetical protein